MFASEGTKNNSRPQGARPQLCVERSGGRRKDTHLLKVLPSNSKNCPLLAKCQYRMKSSSHRAAFSMRWRNKAKCLFQWPPNIVLLVVFMVKRLQKYSVKDSEKEAFFTICSKQMADKHSWCCLVIIKCYLGFGKYNRRNSYNLQQVFLDNLSPNYFQCLLVYQSGGRGAQTVRKRWDWVFKGSTGPDVYLQTSLLLCILNVGFVELHRCCCKPG